MEKKLVILLVVLSSLMCRAVKPGTVSILGDSYSTFENYVEPDTNYLWYFSSQIDTTRTDVHDVELTWWKQFLADNGLVLEKNNSFSGSTICNTGYRGEDYSDRSFITRMNHLGDPELIIIFGATNDFWAKVPFGEFLFNDLAAAEIYTFRPALSMLLQEVKRLYPESQLCFVLNDGITGEFRQAILDKCHQYGVKCLELTDIEKRNGHPNAKGMAEINRQLTKFIKDNDYKL